MLLAKAPYVCHGRIGADLLRAEGYPQHARVCERHTGAGLTKKRDSRTRNSSPQNKIFLPETEEEILICYADKFFSKTHLRCGKNFRTSCKEFGKIW